MTRRYKICPGNNQKVMAVTDTPDHSFREGLYGWHPRPKGVKRIRLTCPRCKRRVMSSVETCHDGCCTYHSIPPHKPKHWWKRKKH